MFPLETQHLKSKNFVFMDIGAVFLLCFYFDGVALLMELHPRAPARAPLFSLIHHLDQLHVLILVEHGTVVLAAAVVRAQATAQALVGLPRTGPGKVLVALLGSFLESERVVDDCRGAGPAHFQQGSGRPSSPC